MSTDFSTFGNFKAPSGAGQAFLFLTAIFSLSGRVLGSIPAAQRQGTLLDMSSSHRWAWVGLLEVRYRAQGYLSRGFTVSCFSRNIFYLRAFYLNIFTFSSFSFHLFPVIFLSALSILQLYQLWCPVYRHPTCVITQTHFLCGFFWGGGFPHFFFFTFWRLLFCQLIIISTSQNFLSGFCLFHVFFCSSSYPFTSCFLSFMCHRLLYYCLITYLIFRDRFVFLVYFHRFLNLHLSLTHQTCMGVLERDLAYLLHFLVPPVLLVSSLLFSLFPFLHFGLLGEGSNNGRENERGSLAWLLSCRSQKNRSAQKYVVRERGSVSDIINTPETYSENACAHSSVQQRMFALSNVIPFWLTLGGFFAGY